jgi:hypothetical protein
MAQLVERLHGMEKVAGSIPASSTPKPEHQAPISSWVLAGFVAGEGTFTRATLDGGSNGPRRTLAFAVGLGATDREMCEHLRALLGVGRVRWYPRRQPHYDDEVVYAVRAFGDLIDVVVPFMDEHLPASHKRSQYEGWRAELLAYDSVRRQRTAASNRRRAGFDPAG